MGQRLGPRVRGDERVEKLVVIRFLRTLVRENERMGYFRSAGRPPAPSS